tara:strand:+ start:1202 stop:2236 length:1035 start_codon:yes stop_codon:yes gene_type:complete
MAVTRTDITITAGFSGTDVLDKLGEALAQLGLLSTSTDWLDTYDSGTYEQRVFAQTEGTGAYNTVYHCFMVKAGETELWYTNFYDYDVSTHKSEGADYLDHAGTYNNPSELSLSSWYSYYTQVADLSNASDTTLSVLESPTGKTGHIWLHNAAESRIMGFVTGTPTKEPNAPVYDSIATPIVMFGWNASYYQSVSAMASIMKRNALSGWHNEGTSSYDFAASPTMTGFAIGGNDHPSFYVGFSGDYNRGHYYTASPAVTGHNNVADGFRGFFNSPLFTPLFTDVHSGEVGCITGHIDTFTPSYGDTLVVSSGVEEYVVLLAYVNTAQNAQNYGNHWTCLVYRSV